MCNVAGYTGTRRAAPVLLDMMEKQEGFCAGFYTGLATIADGKLHWAKTVGNVATLRRTTRAEDLPGNTGIIHSRPDLGGGREWGHPFIDAGERFAYLANGHTGFFEIPGRDEEILNMLAAEGRVFRSHAERYGQDTELTIRRVHRGEIRCRLIEHYRDRGDVPAAALTRAVRDLPAEHVALTVDRDTPDCVHALRINQPLMGARDEDGLYLATTAMAFPREPMEWMGMIPTLTQVCMHGQEFLLTPFYPIPGRVADIFPWTDGETAILECLRTAEDGCRITNFKNATGPLWPKDASPQKDMMIYEIVRRLKAQGRITIEPRTLPTQQPGAEATQFRIFLAAT